MNSASPRAHAKSSLQAAKVDYIASLLLSILMVVGVLSVLLFVCWLTQAYLTPPVSPPGDLTAIEGQGRLPADEELAIAPPGIDEVEDLTSDTLDLSLAAVGDLAANVAATVIDSGTESPSGNGEIGRTGRGLPGTDDNIVPRHERWALKFLAQGLKPYAEQLDFFKIELASIGGTPTVDYASSLSTSPQKRSGTTQQENKNQRLYFMWRTDGPLKQFDTQLLGQAGVNTQGRLILRFIPKELENQLAHAEMIYAVSQGHKSVKEISKTIFESRQSSSGYEFVVIEQFYRKPQ